MSGPGGDDDALERYLRDIGYQPALSETEERLLAALAATGDRDAERRLIQSNLRLVVRLARRYESSGVPLLDLIQEGNVGLMQALEHFDPDKGFRFSVYASWWIRQAINRGIAMTGG